MFKGLLNRKTTNEQEEKDRLNALSEKELLIEIIIELRKVSDKCDDIDRKIVIWGN